MADIIIRKAKQDYVCDVCGHIIHAGEEYLDKVILHDGKAVRHERYHDECPYADDIATDKFIRAFVAGKASIACNESTGEKVRVLGITHDSVQLLDWEYHKVPDVPIKTFLEDYQYD